MKSRILHISQLTAVSACQDQVELFLKTFGEEVALTVANARVFDGVLNTQWTAKELLSNTARTKYKSDYAPLMTKFSADRAALWEKFWIRQKAMLAKYNADHAALLSKIDSKQARLIKKHQSDRAAAWAECYINDEVAA